jgi:hypothetical protein
MLRAPGRVDRRRYIESNKLPADIFLQNFVNLRNFATCVSVTLRIFSRLPLEPKLRLQACKSRTNEEGRCSIILRATNEQVVFTLSGQMDEGNVAELKGLMEAETSGRRIVLELSDLTLVDRDAVRFLDRCEQENIKLENCPAYIREWIAREREGK